MTDEKESCSSNLPEAPLATLIMDPSRAPSNSEVSACAPQRLYPLFLRNITDLRYAGQVQGS